MPHFLAFLADSAPGIWRWGAMPCAGAVVLCGLIAGAEAQTAEQVVPAQCAQAVDDGGNIWTFKNDCSFAVSWQVSCLVLDRFCGVNFVVRVAAKSTKSGFIAGPVMINGPYF